MAQNRFRSLRKVNFDPKSKKFEISLTFFGLRYSLPTLRVDRLGQKFTLIFYGVVLNFATRRRGGAQSEIHVLAQTEFRLSFFSIFWQPHRGSDAEAIRKLCGSRKLNFPIGPAGRRISEVPTNFSGSKVTAD